MESTQVCTPKGAQELLLEFRITGRQEPFEEIVRRYAGMVYHVCMQVTKNAHDAEDATQAVFLTLAVQAKTAKEIRSLGPWLQQVAKRLSLDLRKSRKRRQKREERHGMMADRNHNHNGDDGTVPLQREELKSVLSEELNNLPAKYRLPLILHYFGGLSREAMAAELQCKSGTLGARLHRGRAKLRTRLAERGVTLRDGALAGAMAYSVCMAVTDTLVASTSEAATRLAAGRELGVGLISANVVGMVRRAIQMALYAKLKAVGVGLLLAGTLVAAGAEVVARAGPAELRWTSPMDFGSRLWPLLQPLLRPSYSNATPAGKTDAARSGLAATEVKAGGVLEGGGSGFNIHGGKVEWVYGSLNWPEWSGPLLSDLNGGVTPYLFPGRSGGGQEVVTVGGRGLVDSDREMVIGNGMKLGLADISAAQPAGGPVRVPAAIGSSGFRSAVAGVLPGAGSPVPNTNTNTNTGKVVEYRPLSPATVEATNRPVGPGPEPVKPATGGIVPERSSGGGAYVQQIGPAELPPGVKNPPASGGVDAIGAVASRDRWRDVVLFPSSARVVVPEGDNSGTTSNAGQANVDVAITSGTESHFSAADTGAALGYLDAATVTNSLYIFPKTNSGTDAFFTYNAGQSSGTGLAGAQPVTVDRELVGIRGIPLRGVRIGPPTILRGWGVVENTNIFDQSGQVIADGLGSSQTLDLSQVNQIVHTMSSPIGVGVNGWFAQDGGKLTLPPISVASGPGRYTWGDTAGDPYLDLINSVQIGFGNVVKPGLVDVALLSVDRPDVPTLPTGHHFVGVWEFGGTGVAYDQVGLTVRYDTTMVAKLGLDESKLKLWRYEGGHWEVVSDSFNLDRVQKLISGRTSNLSYFAVSTPEPGGLLVLAAAAMFLGRRRRRD
ncbi:MAG: sigma-70 family RNA polymerase sigma factor [Planctomycetota bacterium]|nr:sigma-70 family RNA polymerase sigma factor [Planctomycetota bacterium]